MAETDSQHEIVKKRPRQSDEKPAYLAEDEGRLLFVIRRCELEHGRKGEPRAATLDEVLQGMGWHHNNPAIKKQNRGKVAKMVSVLRKRTKERRYLDERNLVLPDANRKKGVEGYRTFKPVPGYDLVDDAILSQPSSALFLYEMNTYEKIGDGSARVEGKAFKTYFSKKYGVSLDHIENDIRFLVAFGYMLPFGDPPQDALYYSIHDRYDEERPYLERMAAYAKEFMLSRDSDRQNADD